MELVEKIDFEETVLARRDPLVREEIIKLRIGLSDVTADDADEVVDLKLDEMLLTTEEVVGMLRDETLVCDDLNTICRVAIVSVTSDRELRVVKVFCEVKDALLGDGMLYDEDFIRDDFEVECDAVGLLAENTLELRFADGV